MEQLTYERLQDNLKRLKLFKAVEILAKGGSYLAFLDQLLEEEVAAKDKRRVSTAIKIAGCRWQRPSRNTTSHSTRIWTRSRSWRSLT